MNSTIVCRESVRFSIRTGNQLRTDPVRHTESGALTPATRLGAAKRSHLPPVRGELLNGQTDIAGDPAKQHRREIAALVDRNCRGATIRMAEPLVRTPLAGLFKAKRDQDADGLARLQYRNR